MNRKRLKRLTDVKRRLRDAQKSAVAAAGASLDAADQRLAEEQTHQLEQAAVLSELRTIEAPELSMAADLVAAADLRVAMARTARVQAEAEYERVRTELIEATHDLQRVEKLHERAQKAYAHDVRLREQRDLDEIAGRMGGGV